MANIIDPEKEIEKMLQEKAKATAEQEEKVQQEQQKIEEFLKQFDEAVTSTVRPAMESVGEAAKKAGFAFSIEDVRASGTRELNSSGILLRLMREGSDTSANTVRTAGFWVMANPKSKSIEFYRNTEGYTTRPTERAEVVMMEHLTEDEVKKSALILVRALIQNP